MKFLLISHSSEWHSAWSDFHSCLIYVGEQIKNIVKKIDAYEQDAINIPRSKH